MTRVVFPPIVLRQWFALRFAEALLWLGATWLLSVTSVVVVSIAVCVPNTKVAIYRLTGIVSSDFLLEEQRTQLWCTWQIKKQNALIIQLTAFTLIILAVQEREGELAPGAKCSLTADRRRRSWGMLNFQFAEILVGRGKVLFGFEQ